MAPRRRGRHRIQRVGGGARASLVPGDRRVARPFRPRRDRRRHGGRVLRRRVRPWPATSPGPAAWASYLERLGQRGRALIAMTRLPSTAPKMTRSMIGATCPSTTCRGAATRAPEVHHDAGARTTGGPERRAAGPRVHGIACAAEERQASQRACGQGDGQGEATHPDAVRVKRREGRIEPRDGRRPGEKQRGRSQRDSPEPPGRSAHDGNAVAPCAAKRSARDAHPRSRGRKEKP
jgi:hypothetical protein